MSHALVIVALSPEERAAHATLEAAVEYQMAPFDEAEEWFKDGSRWDWWQIGGRWSGEFPGGCNSITRSELNEHALEANREAKARKLWAAWEREETKNRDEFYRSHIYGLKEDDTLETVMARFRQSLLGGYAFLRARTWHEKGRLGWFSCTTATECEIKNPDEPVNRCIFKAPGGDAQIVSWGEDGAWGPRYWQRFVKPLPSDTILVAVDYHV